MEISYSLIVSQLLVTIAYLILGIGMRKEKRMHILIFSNVYNVFLISSYLILGAISGVISCSVSFVRNLLFMYDEKNNNPTPNYVMFIFVVIAIVLTKIFYKSPIDIFPCALTVITIFTVGSRSTRVNRLGSLFASVCWIIYAIAFKSWIVIICESYLAICTIIGLVKYNFKNTEKKSEESR